MPSFDVFRGGWNRPRILQLIGWLPTRHDHWVQSSALPKSDMMAHAYNSRTGGESWMIRSSESGQQDSLAGKALAVTSLVT